MKVILASSPPHTNIHRVPYYTPEDGNSRLLPIHMLLNKQKQLNKQEGISLGKLENARCMYKGKRYFEMGSIWRFKPHTILGKRLT